MTDSVVSSHFGKRPLLQVPALQISDRQSSVVPATHVPATQPPTIPQAYNSLFSRLFSVLPGPNEYNQSHPSYPGVEWPQNRPHLPAIHRNYTAPAGQQYGSQYPHYHSERAHPSSFNGFEGNYPHTDNHFSRYAHDPRPPPARAPYAGYGLPGPGFNITCDLEYGRIVNIDLRECFGEFRGVPPFLRSELMRTYGSHPYTKVKVRMEGEEFHVFVNHEQRRGRRRLKHRGRDSDTESDMMFDDEYDDDDEEEMYKMLPPRGRRSDADSGRRRLRHRSLGVRPRGVIFDSGRV